MTGVSLNHRTPSSVPAISAARGRREKLPEPTWPNHAYDKGDGRDGERAEVHLAYHFGQRADRSHRSARRDGRAQERQNVYQNDDYADA